MALDLDLFRQKLLDRREELRREEELAAANRAPVELDQESVGRLSRIDAMQVQAMALAQQRRRQSEAAAIDAALKRIDEGEYGYCLTCGDDIVEARMLNAPAVTQCIGCAREEWAG
jgi:DnaK suppressor protein